MKLLIRADASARMGTGHVMRCLALGQAWQDADGQVNFLMASGTPILEARLRAENMTVAILATTPGSDEDAYQTVRLAQKLAARWVVIDGYHFGSDYQRIIKDAGLRLLCIDDYGSANTYCADLVLNQNLYAHEGLYPDRKDSTRLLLGTRYVLLRREFYHWRDWQRELPEVGRRLLISLGGADLPNVTLKVLQGMARSDVDGIEGIAVVGGTSPHLEELQALTKNIPYCIRLRNNVTNMAKLMAWADIAVSGGGSTCWEMAFMGLANCIIVISDNQIDVAKSLQDFGVSINFGWYHNINYDQLGKAISELIKSREKRCKMWREGRNLVNGNGAQSVIEEILQYD